MRVSIRITAENYHGNPQFFRETSQNLAREKFDF